MPLVDANRVSPSRIAGLAASRWLSATMSTSAPFALKAVCTQPRRLVQAFRKLRRLELVRHDDLVVGFAAAEQRQVRRRKRERKRQQDRHSHKCRSIHDLFTGEVAVRLRDSNVFHGGSSSFGVPSGSVRSIVSLRVASPLVK